MKLTIFLKPFLILCLFLLTEMSKAQTIEWEQTNGPERGPIWSFGINKNGELFAGSDGGIFKYSEINGWSQMNALWQSTRVMAITTNNMGQMFAGTWGSGFYRSLNDGDTWELSPDPFYNQYILAIHCNSSGDLFVPCQNKGIYRSCDLGNTWTLINNGLSSIAVRALTFDSNNVIFAATAAGVFRSSNNGDEWAKINDGLTDTNIVDIAVHPDGYIFAISYDSVFYSSDKGDTWDQIIIQDYLYNLCVDIGSNGHILIGEGPGSIYGVFRSTDAGKAWTKHIQGLVQNTGIGEIVFDAGGRIYAVTGDGLFYSDSNGDSWYPKNNGLKATSTNDMICSKNNYIILTNQYGIFRSGDKGNSWEHTLDRTHKDWVESLFLDSKTGKIYACQSYYGFYVSDDEGNTWTGIKMQPYVYKDMHGLAVNSQGHIFVLFDFGIVRSTDNGTTWDTLKNEIKAGRMIIDSEDVIYISYKGVYRSEDNGETWIQCNNGLELNSSIMDFEIEKNGVLYAAFYYGDVYWTSDKGENWQHLTDNGQSANLFDIAITKNGDIIAATSYGALYLQKNSDRWKTIDEGLNRDPHVDYLAIDSSGYIYAGVMGNSVFRATLPTSIKQLRSNKLFLSNVGQNYPNPFCTQTEIPYELSCSCTVSLIIYNSLGIRIYRQDYGYQGIGNYSISFNASNLPEGVYYYNMEMNGIPSNTCKMILMR